MYFIVIIQATVAEKLLPVFKTFSMGNKVNIRKTEILSNEKHTLKKITFDHLKKDGTHEEQTREVYDIGDAVAVLLHNNEQKKVILTKQFRLPSFITGNETGILIESCAGKIGDESPEESIKREIEEETGYRVPVVKKIFEAYTSPGTITEIIHFFVAEYNASMKVNEGGGLKEEHEEIEVIEIPFEEAIQMVNTGEIKDAKTILLLLYAQVQGLFRG
jgi:GDP-mannose pyrophosphatase NudK